MLVNPGGPGASGLNLALIGADVPQHAGDTYDWIGFDPRGVGASKPALSCVPELLRPTGRRTSPSLPRWSGRGGTVPPATPARASKNAAALLPHMKTRDSAQDMDDIRAALGVPKISFYGFSYGTYLGQVYAHALPSRVRRMVLDSNVDPRDVWYQAPTSSRTPPSSWTSAPGSAGWRSSTSAYQLGRTADGGARALLRAGDGAAEAPRRRHPRPRRVGRRVPARRLRAVDLAGPRPRLRRWVHQHDATQLMAAYEDTDTPG